MNNADSDYLRLRARRTVSVPATSEIPLKARLGSTSGAELGGFGGSPQGRVCACAAQHARNSPTANVEYLNSFFIVSLSVRDDNAVMKNSEELALRSDASLYESSHFGVAERVS